MNHAHSGGKILCSGRKRHRGFGKRSCTKCEMMVADLITTLRVVAEGVSEDAIYARRVLAQHGIPRMYDSK